jgi:hypothetical protein
VQPNLGFLDVDNLFPSKFKNSLAGTLSGKIYFLQLSTSLEKSRNEKQCLLPNKVTSLCLDLCMVPNLFLRKAHSLVDETNRCIKPHV